MSAAAVPCAGAGGPPQTSPAPVTCVLGSNETGTRTLELSTAALTAEFK